MADYRNFDAHVRWIVAIGASGPQGLDDIKELLGELPRTVAGVIMVVLHRSWRHPSYLHAILTAATALPVFHRRTNARIVWVSAPGDYALFNSNHIPDGTFGLVHPLLVGAPGECRGG